MWRVRGVPSTTAGRVLLAVGTTALGTAGTAMAAERAATVVNATTCRVAATMVRSLVAGTARIFVVPVMVLVAPVVTKSPSWSPSLIVIVAMASEAADTTTPEPVHKSETLTTSGVASMLGAHSTAVMILEVVALVAASSMAWASTRLSAVERI